MIPTVILPTGATIRTDDWYTGRGARSSSKDEERGGKAYILPEAAQVAVDTALALGEPLLALGDPGTGKTTLAWHLAHVLHAGPVHRFQVQSTSTARGIRYTFDEVRRFRDAYQKDPGDGGRGLTEAHLTLLSPKDRALVLADPRRRYLEPGELWDALAAAVTRQRPSVLLIDEIDKAPRDFPNDLLRDLDQMSFAIPELGGVTVALPVALHDLRPVVVLTSNLERELPGPFLRRCLCVKLELDADIVYQALQARRDELRALTDDFLRLAVRRFFDVRGALQSRKPATGEALVWARALTLRGVTEAELNKPLAELPLLPLLVKDPKELERIRSPQRA